ncbi:serine/threonine protein phosphatase [Macrococcus hajekii]|uniref:Serine/threonine protein phosphatase n=1 Tax=Macrococcus hajekii TaxID=198482 RepID=A0A4R6BIG3_9STAP|nr:metallophosphoesterase family protein [Macrococcus hajekii]TDM01367.1 serine/threonine protein phosphatase [Macrococcus hajekii]
MNYFVVGDVHGCFYTLKKLLQHWDSDRQQLIFVGDYINKGKHSQQVVKLIRNLERKYPGTVCLKGNHEYEMVRYIERNIPENMIKDNFRNTLDHYDLKEKYRDDLKWMKKLPLYHENEALYITHAGVNWLNFRKFKEDSGWCVLRYRGRLKKMSKLQVFGHTPTESKHPEFNKTFNALNIDSGAGHFDAMSAVLIDELGKIKKTYTETIKKEDYR